MPFPLSSLSPPEAEAFLVAYQTSLPARYEAFVAGLRAGGGPADAVESGAAGMVEVWSWFLSTYVRAEPGSPLAASGVELEIPYWLTPVEHYRVGAEGLGVVAGIAAWMYRLLEERFGPLTLRRESDKRDGNYNHPNLPGNRVFLDYIVAAAASQAARGLSEPVTPRFLLTRFEQISESVERALGPGAAPVMEVPVEPEEPTVLFDDESLEAGEVEIDFWDDVDWDRRERFGALLAASNDVIEVVTDDDRGYIIARFGVDRARIEALVADWWKRSAATDN